MPKCKEPKNYFDIAHLAIQAIVQKVVWGFLLFYFFKIWKTPRAAMYWLPGKLEQKFIEGTGIQGIANFLSAQLYPSSIQAFKNKLLKRKSLLFIPR